MCPTLLGQAYERNGIFGEFRIEFDKKLDNGFDKPIWDKCRLVDIQCNFI